MGSVSSAYLYSTRARSDSFARSSNCAKEMKSSSVWSRSSSSCSAASKTARQLAVSPCFSSNLAHLIHDLGRLCTPTHRSKTLRARVGWFARSSSRTYDDQAWSSGSHSHQRSKMARAPAMLPSISSM